MWEILLQGHILGVGGDALRLHHTRLSCENGFMTKIASEQSNWKHNGGLFLGFGDRPSRFPFRVWRSGLLPPFAHEEEEEECSSSSLRLGVYFFTSFDRLLVHVFRGVLEVQIFWLLDHEDDDVSSSESAALWTVENGVVSGLAFLAGLWVFLCFFASHKAGWVGEGRFREDWWKNVPVSEIAKHGMQELDLKASRRRRRRRRILYRAFSLRSMHWRLKNCDQRIYGMNRQCVVIIAVGIQCSEPKKYQTLTVLTVLWRWDRGRQMEQADTSKVSHLVKGHLEWSLRPSIVW